jgi:hypothetical protein
MREGCIIKKKTSRGWEKKRRNSIDEKKRIIKLLFEIDSRDGG